MEALTISSMTLRLGGVLTLILGLIFWSGNLDGLQPIHMTLGILVVASLLWLAFLFAQAGQSMALVIAAVVVGVALVVVGLTQQSILTERAHWVIQVTHLVLGLAALGLGEVMGARLRRGATAAG